MECFSSKTTDEKEEEAVMNDFDKKLNISVGLEPASWQTQLDAPKRFKYILENGKFTDCEIIVGEQKEKFRCHKMILAMASPLFENLLYENKMDVLTFDDVNAEAFKYTLEFLYLQKLCHTQFPYHIVGKLLYVAKRFKIDNFRIALMDVLSAEPWPVEHILSIYNAAKFYSNNLLLALGIDHIVKYKNQLLNHTSLYSQSFLSFKNIMQLLFRKVSHFSIFETIERYCLENNLFLNEPEDECENNENIQSNQIIVNNNLNHNNEMKSLKRSSNELGVLSRNESRKSKIKELCELIDFKSMSPSEFATGPANSKLLDKNESYEILLSICKDHYCQNGLPVFNFNGIKLKN